MDGWVPIIIAALGGGGIFAVIRESAAMFTLVRNGVSGREDRRRADIIAARDRADAERKEAEARATDAERRADVERDRRRTLEDELVLARRQLMEAGLNPRAWPDIEDTDNPRHP